MPNSGEMEVIDRRTLTVFFLLDTSGSMSGDKISTLNNAMEETLDILKEQAKSNADAELKIAVLEFNTSPKWKDPNGPVSVDDFYWEDLKAGGSTEVGAALNELNSKLSRDEFLKATTGAYYPIIIFMSDGHPTDEYKPALEEIRNNKWFLRGVKIGFALGDDADEQMISNVVGNPEAVIKTSDLETFGRLLQFVTITSSMMQSQSKMSDDPLDGGTIVQEALKQEEESGNTAATSVNPDDVEITPEPDAWGDVDDDDDWV